VSSIVPAPSFAFREFVAGEAVRLLMVEAIAGKIGRLCRRPAGPVAPAGFVEEAHLSYPDNAHPAQCARTTDYP
jgi:hypothetical protein